MNKKLIQKIRNINRLRTKLLVKYFPAYVKYKLNKRKGFCYDCSLCCGNCNNLAENGRCLIYAHRADNPSCYMEFPIDKLDLIISLGKSWRECNYRW